MGMGGWGRGIFKKKCKKIQNHQIFKFAQHSPLPRQEKRTKKKKITTRFWQRGLCGWPLKMQNQWATNTESAKGDLSTTSSCKPTSQCPPIPIKCHPSIQCPPIKPKSTSPIDSHPPSHEPPTHQKAIVPEGQKGQKDRRTERPEGQKDRKTEGQNDRRTKGQGDRGTEGQKERGTEEQKDRKDRRTEGQKWQTDRKTEGQQKG